MKFLTVSALALTLAVMAQGFSFFSSSSSNSKDQIKGEWQKKALGQPDHEFRFTYDAQLSSGYAAWISPLKAQQRLQAEVLVNFPSERSAILRIEDAQLGQANDEIDASKIQSMKAVRRSNLPEDKLTQLRLPVEFTFTDGLVERVRFAKEDPTWSRNIKKAIINLMQVNLRKASFDPELTQSADAAQQKPRVFTETEITLEGECPVAYTISSVGPYQWNVTKSVEFSGCQQVADTAYGFQTEQTESQLSQQQQQQLNNGEAQSSEQQKQQAQPSQPIPQEKLERSTVYRFQIRADKDGKKIAILNSEVVSDYQIKSMQAESQNAQQIVALANLRLRSVEPKKTQKPKQKLDQEESLLYNAQNESEQKRFFMYGDEEFMKNPFDAEETEESRVQQIKKNMRQITDSFEKNQHESKEEIINQVVEALRAIRRASLKTLRNIREQIKEKIERELYDDMLALAATRNPIALLAEHIPKMSALQAIKSLKSISGNMVAPSESIAQQLLDMCKKIEQQGSDESQSAKQQTCWIAFSAIVGQLNQQQKQAKRSAQYPTQKEEQQMERKLEQFQQVLEERLEKADEQDEYKQVLALKSLANAGLEKTIPTIEKIIKDTKKSAFIRTEAIDSLRRMRHDQPQKLQQILMPVFVNNKEKSEPRMAALSLIASTLSSQPQQSKPIVDQIAYTLLNERSEQVRAFTYSLIQSYSESPCAYEKEVSQQMKQALQISNVDEEEQLKRASRKIRVPVYSHTEKEGIFVGATLAFSPESILPTHVAAYVDNMLNGFVNKHSIYVSVCQQNVDKWVQRLVNQARKSVRSSKNRKGAEEIRKLLEGIKVQERQRSSATPFAMLSIRVKDVDQVILPLTDKTVTDLIENYGTAKSFADYFQIEESAQGRFHSLISAHETALVIPTVTGFKIEAEQLTIALANGAAKANAKIDLNKHVQGVVELQRAQLAVEHQQKIRVVDPITRKHTGVASHRSIEIQTPKDTVLKIGASYANGITAEIRASDEKAKLASVRTLPYTFIGQHQIRSVQNRQLQQLQREVRYNGKSIRVSGVVHKPLSWQSPSEVLKTILAAENHLVVEYMPSQSVQESATIKLQGSLFQPAEIEEAQSQELKQFYKNQRQITRNHQQWNGDYEQNSEDDEYDQDEQKKTDKFMTAYSKSISTAGTSNKAYKHQLKVVAEYAGKKAQLQLQATCDASLTACRSELNIQRPAINGLDEQEKQDWKLKVQAATLLPENMKRNAHNQILAVAKAQWGQEKQQQVTLHLSAKPQPRFPKELSLILNQVDLSADYKLSRSNQQSVEEIYQLFKAYYYLQSEVRSSEKAKNSAASSEGHIRARLSVEPFTRRAVNLTIQTPNELFHLENVPTSYKLGLRVQKQESRPAYHSVGSMVGRAVDESLEECRIQKNNLIQTFDNSEYRAPLSSRCYSVIAKDCQNVGEPQFVILAKQQTDDKKNNNKIVKVITPDNTLEVQPKSEDKNEEELKVRWNGEDVKPFELPQENVEFDGEQVYARFNGVSIRFNGQKLSVKLSPEFSNAQCGLCGRLNADDESLRTASNEITNDVAEFHRSYNVRDAQCTEEHEKEFYGDEKKQQLRFRQMDNEWNTRSNQAEDEDESSSWEARYDEDNKEKSSSSSQSEEDGFDYETGKPKNIAPKNKIHVHEYKHKLCFSKTPVKRCESPAYPVEESQKEEQREYSCFERHSSDARRLQREVRQPMNAGKTLAQLAEKLDIQLARSFVQNVLVDGQCKRAELVEAY